LYDPVTGVIEYRRVTGSNQLNILADDIPPINMECLAGYP